MDNKKKFYVCECESKTFVQESDKMIITDPSYQYNPEEHKPDSTLWKLNLVIDNVLCGNWDTYVIVRHDYTDRNTSLICVHDSIDLNMINKTWISVGEIGVDSGQAGVYDLKHYPNTNNNIDETWYEKNCNITSIPTDYAGAISFGAVSSSGFGDGFYNVYVIKNDNSQIIGIKIVFITDADIENWSSLQKNIIQ